MQAKKIPSACEDHYMTHSKFRQREKLFSILIRKAPKKSSLEELQLDCTAFENNLG